MPKRRKIKPEELAGEKFLMLEASNILAIDVQKFISPEEALIEVAGDKAESMDFEGGYTMWWNKDSVDDITMVITNGSDILEEIFGPVVFTKNDGVNDCTPYKIEEFEKILDHIVLGHVSKGKKNGKIAVFERPVFGYNLEGKLN